MGITKEEIDLLEMLHNVKVTLVALRELRALKFPPTDSLDKEFAETLPLTENNPQEDDTDSEDQSDAFNHIPTYPDVTDYTKEATENF